MTTIILVTPDGTFDFTAATPFDTIVRLEVRRCDWFEGPFSARSTEQRFCKSNCRVTWHRKMGREKPRS